MSEEIQMLDGMLDPNTHDEFGRRHGEIRMVGEPYDPNIGLGYWTLVVTYSHGRQEFPVSWLNPAGMCERRSRSFWKDDNGGNGPIVLRPDGWTRLYGVEPRWGCDGDVILWEGFKGPSTPKEHITYESPGEEVVCRNRWTRNLRPRPRVTERPRPNQWPQLWNPKAKQKKVGQTITNVGVYTPCTSSNSSTT